MNSIGSLYIDCPDLEKNISFQVEKELTEDEYVKMLREYSTTIGVNTPYNNFYNNKKNDVREINYQKEKTNFKKASTKIFNIKGEPCGVKELYDIQRRGMGVLIIDIFDTNLDESFETEFMFWKKDSMNINNDTEISKDERIRFLPIKDLQFEIDNHMFLLTGCKIYCEYSRMKVALIIQKIKEI